MPLNLNNFALPTTFTPDGSQIFYYHAASADSSVDIYSLSLVPEQTTSPLLNSDYTEASAAISPNGYWLAYITNETGRNQVYVRPYPDVESDKWQVSAGGGGDPQWAADTGELFYRNRTDEGIETYVVEVDAGDEFRAGRPQLLFTSDHLYFNETGNYSPSADGQRLIMMKPVDMKVEANMKKGIASRVK